VRHVIDCIQPHHQGVYTCSGQARDQTMASDPVAISIEGMYEVFKKIKRNKFILSYYFVPLIVRLVLSSTLIFI